MRRLSRDFRSQVRFVGVELLRQLMVSQPICHIHLELWKRTDRILLARLTDTISGRGQRRRWLRVDERYGSKLVPTRWKKVTHLQEIPPPL